MGCDIHCYLEQQKKEKWIYVKEIDIWRDYTLFNIFGYTYRNNTEMPICGLRGVPNDISSKVYKILEAGKEDYHSPGWLYIHEILNYDWNKKNIYQGYLTSYEIYSVLIESGKMNPLSLPNLYVAGMINGMPGFIETFYTEVYAQAIDVYKQDSKLTERQYSDYVRGSNQTHYYCYAELEYPIAALCKTFYSEVLPQLQKCNHNDRVVFWFDN